MGFTLDFAFGFGLDSALPFGFRFDFALVLAMLLGFGFGYGFGLWLLAFCLLDNNLLDNGFWLFVVCLGIITILFTCLLGDGRDPAILVGVHTVSVNYFQ